jgi:hypothetical protein
MQPLYSPKCLEGVFSEVRQHQASTRSAPTIRRLSRSGRVQVWSVTRCLLRG